MAGFYKKKKRSTGPSKNDEKVQRGRDAERMSGSGNSLGSRFPTVSSLSLKLVFLSPHGAALGEEDRAFKPNDACDLAAACPGQCGVGDFDLAKKIDAMVANGQPVLEASGKCVQPIYAGAKELCGTELRLRAVAEYKPAPSPTTAP